MLLAFSNGEVDEYTEPVEVEKTLSAAALKLQGCLLVNELNGNMPTMAMS
eukprot:CAMPEP_0173069196 /NCGR_PEP_ID=MMETSP1102-20130122/7867_1 /TAXON_ID=49646 /ORGANISM="Geminigera sp., Strain Caron Lab Isolate" /LENGTH=49 /DNA_ID=CAMNT_0013937207 /DNA_START=194 /DNA_END=343 /DNA_ORIENTATION=-